MCAEAARGAAVLFFACLGAGGAVPTPCRQTGCASCAPCRRTKRLSSIPPSQSCSRGSPEHRAMAFPFRRSTTAPPNPLARAHNDGDGNDTPSRPRCTIFHTPACDSTSATRRGDGVPTWKLGGRYGGLVVAGRCRGEVAGASAFIHGERHEGRLRERSQRPATNTNRSKH